MLNISKETKDKIISEGRKVGEGLYELGGVTYKFSQGAIRSSAEKLSQAEKDYYSRSWQENFEREGRFMQKFFLGIMSLAIGLVLMSVILPCRAHADPQQTKLEGK